MTLPVPLTVRVGDQHVTKQAQAVSFRREAVGGVRSISFSLARSLSDLAGLDPLAKVYVYDARNARTVAEGRLADTGRTASADGQRWECVAFGPAQHASDIAQPSVFIDRSISDGWRLADVVHADAAITSGAKPGDTSGTPSSGLIATFQAGIAINTNSSATLRYESLWLGTGQVLGGFSFNWDAIATVSNWRIEAVTRVDGSGVGENVVSDGWDVAGGSASKVAGIDFPADRNTVDMRIRWMGGAVTTTGETWAWFDNIAIRPRLKRKDGTDRAASDHAVSYVMADDVVEDVLGRLLPQYDRARATVDQTAPYRITTLAYRDGVTPEQIFDDLMRLNPSHRWTTTPDANGSGYGFRWEPWPATVRYEATLDDGGSFPISTQGVYDEVAVRWIDATEGVRTTYLTAANVLLDEAGVRRRAYLDLGTEAGSSANATQAGQSFLDEHSVPKNAGTLTVARAIRDLSTGAMVQPWEIEAGELVRIRGVEAYPDVFNASSNDGQGVFRIFAVDYTSEGNVATLALDSDPRETADALVRLLKERKRR